MGQSSTLSAQPIPDRWEDSMQVAGVPPLWGALAALATLVGKKATQKIMKKMIDAGVKDPKKQQQLIKKQIEKVKGKGAGDAAIAAGEVALNEYLHYTKKQEDAGEPRNKLAHASGSFFNIDDIAPGRGDGILHLAEEPINLGEGARRNDSFFRSRVDINDMEELPDLGGWPYWEIAEHFIDKGTISAKEWKEIVDRHPFGETGFIDKRKDLFDLLVDRGVSAFKYKNDQEDSWEHADRDVTDTYSVGVLDKSTLEPSAQFGFPKAAAYLTSNETKFDLGSFASEGDGEEDWSIDDIRDIRDIRDLVGVPQEEWTGKSPKVNWDSRGVDHLGKDGDEQLKYAINVGLPVYNSFIDLKSLDVREEAPDFGDAANRIYETGKWRELVSEELIKSTGREPSNHELWEVAVEQAKQSLRYNAVHMDEPDPNDGSLPPILVQRGSKGTLAVVSGESRVLRWIDEGYEKGPAIVIDNMEY